jgi:16S rRNA (uracil1498-N3)-methyltransferase
VGGGGQARAVRVLIAEGSGVVGRRARLDEHETHHLRVRRARPHDSVEVLDGAGLVGIGQLLKVKGDWMVEIESAEQTTARPELVLAVAAGDRERFSWMVEKAVELEATTVVPLETDRTAGVSTRLRSSHIAKLRRLALETTKQCGAAWAPIVEAPVSLAAFTARPLKGRGWLADSEGAPPPSTLDQSALTVVIGPEGGFTGDERAALLVAGYRPVSLGSHTLRFETAALAAIAAAATARMRGNHG